MIRQTVKNYEIINLFINKIQVYLQNYIYKYFYEQVYLHVEYE